jgi:hypothetical protein
MARCGAINAVTFNDPNIAFIIPLAMPNPICTICSSAQASRQCTLCTLIPIQFNYNYSNTVSARMLASRKTGWAKTTGHALLIRWRGENWGE